MRRSSGCSGSRSASTAAARCGSSARGPTSRSGSKGARASSRPASATCPTARSSTARVEDSAQGVITYAEFPAVYLGHDVVGARLVFRGGRVVEASADEGEEFLQQVLATDAGASRLGELGLGCNPQDHALHAQRPLRREDRRHRPPRGRRQLHLHGRQERERRALGHGQGPAPRRRAARGRRARPARRHLADLGGSADEPPQRPAPPRARRRRSRP